MEQEHIRDQIIELRKKGFTYRQILRETGLKSTSTVFYHIKKSKIAIKSKREIIETIYILIDEIYNSCDQKKLKEIIEKFLE